MDQNGYPEESVIRKIKKWDIMKEGVDGLLDLVEENWKYAEAGGFRLTGKQVRKLECHTYGWSGNEDIIQALEKNTMFWPLYWYKSLRGGHYYFQIKLFHKGAKKGMKSIEDANDVINKEKELQRKKDNIDFTSILSDPEFQKSAEKIRRKTGKLKPEDYHKQFTI